MSKGRSDSEQDKLAELKAKLKPGSIIYQFCNFINDPKNKFVVIAHIDFENDDSLIFIVNSEIRPLIEHDPYLKEGQIPLVKEPHYTFLDHDSFVNCVEVFCLDLDFTINYLLEFPDDYKGELQKEEIDRIVSYVKASQTISRTDINTIIHSLGK